VLPACSGNASFLFLYFIYFIAPYVAMKNQQLKLDELKIQSFVTSFEGNGDMTVHGGLIPASFIDGCRSALLACYPIQTLALCPIRTLNSCGSLLDACPSAISCPFDFEGLTIQ
jgi:hypothetical protein